MKTKQIILLIFLNFHQQNLQKNPYKPKPWKFATDFRQQHQVRTDLV